MSRLKVFDAVLDEWVYVGGGDETPYVGASPPVVVTDGMLWWDTDDSSIMPDTIAPSVLAADSAFTSKYVPIAGGVILTKSAQPITTATVTDLIWDTEVSDIDGWTAGGIATLTVPTGKGMRYGVCYSGSWPADPGTLAGMTCLVNGSGLYDSSGKSAFGTYVNIISFIRTLAAGDTLKFRCYQNSGIDKNLTSRLEIAPV